MARMGSASNTVRCTAILIRQAESPSANFCSVICIPREAFAPAIEWLGLKRLVLLGHCFVETAVRGMERVLHAECGIEKPVAERY